VFTGLIEEVGNVLYIGVTEGVMGLKVSAPFISQQVRKGQSISVNGCCLTIATHNDDLLTFDLLDETVERTNLRYLRRDSPVNLERALSVDGRLDGHFVQGHVDCTAEVLTFDRIGGDYRLEVSLPTNFSHYVAYKGSIAVNGVSLTIAELLAESFAVWIIPHTRRQTNLDRLNAGELVNLEFDLIAKYIERLLPPGDRKE